MTDSDAQQSQGVGGHREEKPMSMCPMSSMCKGMAAKPPSLVLMLLPGHHHDTDRDLYNTGAKNISLAGRLDVDLDGHHDDSDGQLF